ncbi:MAG: hypothetical protein AAF004_13930 [Pseudomonadota bacterium]
MNSENLQLWLEFEEYAEGQERDAGAEYFNMTVTVAGRRYALNVWSYGYMKRLFDGVDGDADELAVGYSFPPDLFVQTCSRAHMEKVVRHLIDTDALDKSWLVEDDDQD